MFFTRQLEDLIESERKAFRAYLVWLLLTLAVAVTFISVSLVNGWLVDQFGTTLGSAFLLLLSKPPFTEMMKRKEKIKTMESIRRMAQVVQPESKDAEEIEKLVMKTFRDMLKK